MKFLVGMPLTIIILVSILSLLGMAAPGGADVFTLGGDPSKTIYYDEGGHAVCYANGTAYDEPGNIFLGAPYPYAFWRNASFPPGFLLLYEGGTTSVKFEDVGQGGPDDSPIEATFNDANLGLIAIIVGFLIFAGIVGLRIFSSGISEASINIILIGTMYMALWALFSALSYPVIALMSIMGPIFWFALTVCYAVGLLSTVGNQADSGGST